MFFHRRKRWQPCFPTITPQLIAWNKLVWPIKCTQMQFNLLPRQRMGGGAAYGAKLPPLIRMSCPGCHNAVRRINRRRIEQGTVMFAAIKAMANPDPQRRARGGKPHRPAKAPAAILPLCQPQPPILSCVLVSKSPASWRSCSCNSRSPLILFTIRPRLTAGRASIRCAQSMTWV